MKASWLLGVFAVVAMACSTTLADTIALDNGYDTGAIEWYGPGDEVNMNVFPTSMLDGKAIDQLIVAWGNSPGSARVVLYSVSDLSGLPYHTGLPDPTKVIPLLTVNTTVTAGEENPIDTSSPPEHRRVLANFTPYDITPTTISTPYFAIAAIGYNPTGGGNAITPMDLETNMPHLGSQGLGWYAYANGTITTDLQNVGTGSNFGPGDSPSWIPYWSGFGFGNNPFLIRAGRWLFRSRARWRCSPLAAWGWRLPSSAAVGRRKPIKDLRFPFPFILDRLR